MIFFTKFKAILLKKMDDYNKIEDFPILYGIEKNGKVKVWKASVYLHLSSNKAMSVIEFGQLDGKKQTSTREYTEGKNIGKKNETTPLQQCLNETRKKWSDKKEKESYKENKEEDKDEKYEKDEKYFPMLAHTYEPDSKKNKKNDIKFPCFVQPKLDGLRCIIYRNPSKKIVCQSRTGAFFDTMDHITEELSLLFNNNKDLILDGELYTNVIPFEELAGLIKKKKINDADRESLKNVKYNVYDIINDKIYEERYNKINKYINGYKYIEKVPTYMVNKKEEFMQYFSNFIENGFEGIMLRNIDGMYRCNYRSHDLQKYKEFKEDEYTITSYKEGEGRDKGTVIWICKASGKEFSVRPKGSIESRRELFENGYKYIGKKLTVIYQELSEQGVPRFPVGKSIREDY